MKRNTAVGCAMLVMLATVGCGSSGDASGAATPDDVGANPDADGGSSVDGASSADGASSTDGAASKDGSSSTDVGGGDAGGGDVDGSIGPGPDSVVDVAAGASFSCAVLASGGVSCWGLGGTGQLGVDPSTLVGCVEPKGSMSSCRSAPARVAGLANVTHVQAEQSGACALTTSGDLYCWGRNDHGQLGHAPGTAGDGTCVDPVIPSARVACNWSPQKVSGIANVSALAVGQWNVCAVSAGQVYCWGYDGAWANGQGNGEPKDLFAPTLVPGLPSDITELAGSMSTAHVCALSAAAGIFCWGTNDNGELGHKTGAGTPADQSRIACCGYGNSTPQLVPSTTGLHSLIAPESATCAIDASGAVVCWGDNQLGELAIGSRTIQHMLAPTVSLVTGAASLVGESNSPLCALRADGSLTCWGPAQTGELGNGAYDGLGSPDGGIVQCGPQLTGCAPSPQDVAGVRFKRVSTGQEGEENGDPMNPGYGGHVVALGTDGKVYAWGANIYGEGGHDPGTGVDQECTFTTATLGVSVRCIPTPTPVAGLP